MVSGHQHCRVGLLVESSRGYGRGLLHGIAAYARAHRHWSIDQHERRLDDPAPNWLRQWHGEGLLVRLENRSLIRRIAQRKICCVGFSGAYRHSEVSLVQSDEAEIVRLAIEHLLGQGFPNLAFCGFPDAYYSDDRRAAFETLVSEMGRLAHVFQPKRRTRAKTTVEAEEQGMQDHAQLAGWLRSLPKPVGLIACNDMRAQHVLNICRGMGLHVPDEIAVIGVDDDDVICDLCTPRLTSVRQNTFQIGYQAAELLDRMMQGDTAAPQVILVPAIGVITRESTDVIVTDDREVACALRYIREHACENIRVDAVVRSVSLSRSTLERRFENIVGRSPKQEIDRVRIEAVLRLLKNTAYKLPTVAAMTGFPHPEYLMAFVKAHTGQSPGELRKHLREDSTGALEV